MPFLPLQCYLTVACQQHKAVPQHLETQCSAKLISLKMPPLSTDDYHKLLQKIAVLETKIHRLEVNVEVNGLNGLGGNDTTLPLPQISGQELANTRLTSADTATMKQVGSVLCYKSTSSSPPWNHLGAKPKNKSCPWVTGGRLTGRAQRAEICDETGWPALPPRQNASSTPVSARTQPWKAAKGRISNKPPKQPSTELHNRYSPLMKDPESPSGQPPSDGVRTDSMSNSKKLQGKLKSGPQTLIVGDNAIRDLQRVCSKNTKVICFPKDMVSNMTERILHIVAEHPTVKNFIIHVGSNDVVKQQSEVLKQDFTELLKTVSSVKADVFISGPIPPVRNAEERFSRLRALNKWLSTACTAHSVHFIEHFHIFWERRHLFKANGLFLNKPGVKLLVSNLFYFLRHSSVPSAKDFKQKESVREKDKTQRNKNLEEEQHSPPPKESSESERHQSQEEEESPQASIPLNNSTYDGPPVSPPQTPTRSLSSLLSLSPSSPHLEFTDQMKELVIAGLKCTPRPSPIFSPINTPRRPAPPPPPTQAPKPRRPAPPVPLRKHHVVSPQPDKDDKAACVQNITSTN